jgi:hypothetical protein
LHNARSLRIIFDDVCWSALNQNDVPFRHLTLPREWILLHSLYALALADFRAVLPAVLHAHRRPIHWPPVSCFELTSIWGY